MRLIPSLLLGTFVAVVASSALAETPNTHPSVEPGDFADYAESRLGDEFEKSLFAVGDGALTVLGGPTSMRCKHALAVDVMDTCVVTAQGMPNSAPAALAQN